MRTTKTSKSLNYKVREWVTSEATFLGKVARDNEKQDEMRVSEGKGKIHATDCQSSKESEERAGGLSQVR
jgi:hypothetical protein